MGHHLLLQPGELRNALRQFQTISKALERSFADGRVGAVGQHRLTRDDGDIVLDLVGDDRIWQKERLLNIALAALPAHVEYVAWIDSDIIFEDRDWATKARRRLSRQGGLLQLFETVAHLPPDVDLPNLSAAACAQYTPVFTGVSIASAMAAADNQPKPIFVALQAQGDGQYMLDERSLAVGIAWAAHRGMVAACGLYDRNIVGGGDSIQAFAALDRLDDYYSYRQLTLAHKDDARLWAEAARSTGLFTVIDALDGKLYHLWHGAFEDRHYRRRYDILYSHDFDPRRDIRHLPNGTWGVDKSPKCPGR